jgi:hypothetical protein
MRARSGGGGRGGGIQYCSLTCARPRASSREKRECYVKRTGHGDRGRGREGHTHTHTHTHRERERWMEGGREQEAKG